MIYDYKPYIETLLSTEPWRALGSSTQELCGGHVDYDGSRFWMCTGCGRIGTASHPMHYPALHPGKAVLSLLRGIGRALLRPSP